VQPLVKSAPGGVRLLAPAACATAAVLGVVAALQPLIAVGIAGGLIFAYFVFADLAAGFAVLAFLSFLDTLPTSGALSLAKAAGLLLAVAWLAQWAAGAADRRDFFADYPHLTWVLVAFLGWGVLSLLWAPQFGTGLTALSRYAPNILLLPIAYTALRTRRDLSLVLGAIVLGAVLAAAFGVLQPPQAGLIEESSRATGTVGDPNELAAFVLVGLALAAGFALGREHSPLVRVGAALAVPLCAAGIFLSLSRGGLVAFAFVLVAGAFLAGRWRFAVTAILLALALGGTLYFTQLAPLPARERISAANGGTGRSDLWKVGLRMVQANPVGGVGVGNFQASSPDFTLQPGTITRADLIFSSAPKVTHNTYLEIAAEMGLPGVILFGIIICSSLACGLKAARTWAARGQPTMEALARGAVLGLIGMLVADFFISDMYTKLLWVMLAIGPAMLAIVRSEGDSESTSAPAAL
jgi:putative inorganic carbon (hco3(-)) transporter